MRKLSFWSLIVTIFYASTILITEVQARGHGGGSTVENAAEDQEPEITKFVAQYDPGVVQ